MGPNDRISGLGGTYRSVDFAYDMYNPRVLHDFMGTGMIVPTPERNHDKAVLKVMDQVKKSAIPVKVIDEKKATKEAARLKELGFSSLHGEVEKIAERSMKENLAALAGFKKIPWAKYQEADKKLRDATASDKKLALTRIEEYVGQHHEAGEKVDDGSMSLPPSDVLDKLEEAKKHEIFDAYSIIHVVRGPDPILVGIIKGTKDMFMIAEWGNDISFDEVMA